MVDDRRVSSSHGYRAVHVIPRVAGKPIEIQLRTQLQHLWAELSETLAFQYYVGLKYGEEVPEARALLGEVRFMREAILSASDKDDEREALRAALNDPEVVGRFYDSLEDGIKSRLNGLREMIEATRRELIKASQDIQTIEATLPGHETAEAQASIEKQIQGLLSRLETLG